MALRPQDFGNPKLAGQLLDAFGEDRGEGWHLYRFPLVFPSDHWPTVMPHELAAWGTNDKRYWSDHGEATGGVPRNLSATARKNLLLFAREPTQPWSSSPGRPGI